MGGNRGSALAVLSSAAMCLNFLWFDMCGHASVLIGFDLWLRAGGADGHTLFLLGMLAASIAMTAVPRAASRFEVSGVVACSVLGMLAAATMVFRTPMYLAVVGAVVTGFTNIFILAATLVLLAHVEDRAAAAWSVVLVFAARSVLMYAFGTLIPDSCQVAVLLALPVTSGALVLVARRFVDGGMRKSFDLRVKFEKPLSSAMLGILMAASVIFAVACVVSSVGFWGTDHPFRGLPPAYVLLGTAAFVALGCATLVRTEASLLFRFLPGTFVLFAAHSFLYLGLGRELGATDALMSVVSQYAELYGEAFVWAVTLLAIRTLRTGPYRTVGLSFAVNAGATVLLQYALLGGWSGSAIVLVGFYGVFAALVWALYHFHGMDDRFRSERCAECSSRAVGGVPVSKAGDVGSGVRREAAEPALRLAASAGLSERETDVFMLLAQGRSRRFICDELFIADGTASSHIGHIYEKLGVHSKQELITLVRMECDNESQACGLNQRVWPSVGGYD